MPDLEKKKELQTFKNQLQKHNEATIDYRRRLESQGLEVSPTWRGLGAAESNVDRFKLRTAKRGWVWSKRRLKAILRMLGLLYENTLQDFVKKLNIDPAITENIVVMSAGKVAKTVGRKTLRPLKKSGFVSLGVNVSSRKLRKYWILQLRFRKTG